MSKKNRNFAQIFKTYSHEYRKHNQQQKDDFSKAESHRKTEKTIQSR